jgi:hypothetical protein
MQWTEVMCLQLVQSNPLSKQHVYLLQSVSDYSRFLFLDSSRSRLSKLFLHALRAISINTDKRRCRHLW